MGMNSVDKRISELEQYKQKEHDARIGAGIVLVVLALYVLFFR